MKNVLLWGLFFGLLIGFLLNMWLSRRDFPLKFWGESFARDPNSSSFDLHLMFKELQQKTGDLDRKIVRVDAELLSLQMEIRKMKSELVAPVPAGGFLAGVAQQKRAAVFPLKNPLPTAGQPLKVLQCRQEIYRLYQEGLSLQEIARQLRIRQGEVELVLSLKESRI